MRYIPTTSASVEALKKQAKRLQRQRAGKHTDLLDRVARGAGYDHWHHVMRCLAEGETDATVEAIEAKCARILEAAAEYATKIVVTGPELLAEPLILYAALGDAWILEPAEGLLLCLKFKGEVQPRSIAARRGEIEIAWDGSFALDGPLFRVDSAHPLVGIRAIDGYPLQELREVIERASTDRKFMDLFLQADAKELTPELIGQLVAGGWDRQRLEQGMKDGLRYLPSRDSLVLPPVHGS